MEKSFGGDLARAEVPDLLSYLHMGRRTGVLLLERTGQQTSVYFRDGDPIYGNSSREGLRLCDILVRQGKLQAEQVAKIVESHRATGNRVGQVLVAARILTPEELVSFLKVQTSEVVFDIFRWHGGTFAFYDDVGPPAGAVVLEMDLKNLIMEGVRRLDEEGRLALVFPHLNWVAALVSSAESIKQRVTLTPQEWRIYFLVDGRRSLTEICQIAGDPVQRETLEILRLLVEANLVEVTAPREKAAEAAAPAGAAPEAREQPAGNGGAPAESFHIALAAAQPTPREEDDSREIVNPEAVDYAESMASRPQFARLIMVRDVDELSFPMTRESTAVGRHENNDIVVDNDQVSAFHARIDRGPDGYVLVDLASTNGTFLNSHRVTVGIMKSGDEIRLGPARLRFKLDQASAMGAANTDDPPGGARRPAARRR
jgi:hypothetical protein